MSTLNYIILNPTHEYDCGMLKKSSTMFIWYINQLLFTLVKFIMSKITAIQTHRLVIVFLCGMMESVQTDWDF